MPVCRNQRRFGDAFVGFAFDQRVGGAAEHHLGGVDASTVVPDSDKKLLNYKCDMGS